MTQVQRLFSFFYCWTSPFVVGMRKRKVVYWKLLDKFSLLYRLSFVRSMIYSRFHRGQGYRVSLYTCIFLCCCCCCSHGSIVAHGHGDWFWSTFGHQVNGVRFTHHRSWLQLYCGPAYFMEPTQLLHHPGHWVLAGLHVMSFNVMKWNSSIRRMKKFKQFNIYKNKTIQKCCQLWYGNLTFAIKYP